MKDDDFKLHVIKKLDSISDKLCDIEVTQGKHEVNLQEHMRRSQLAEDRMELIESEIKPLLQGLTFLKVAAKIGGFLGTLVYSFIRLFR